MTRGRLGPVNSRVGILKSLGNFVRSALLHPAYPGSYFQLRDNETEAYFGWTIDSVTDALKSFCDGDLESGAELAMAMLRDTEIAGCIETRAETCVQLDRWWEKPKDCPQWIFDVWVDHWARCLTSADLQSLHEDRLLHGITPSNQTWAPDSFEPTPGRLWVPTVYPKDPGNLEYVESNGVYGYTFQARDKEYPADNDGERFLLWTRKGRRPHMSGLLIPLAIVWIIKQEALRQWPSRNKSHGKAWRLLEFPADQRESKDVKDLIELTKTLLAGGVVPLPKYAKDMPSFDLRLISDNTDVSATFANLIKLCDAYIRRLILGVEENTSGGSASDAKAQTQDRVFLRKVKSDAKRDIETLGILARCFCRANRLPERWAPVYCVDADPPEDENEEAKRQLDRADAGSKIVGMFPALDAKGVAYDPAFLLEQAGLYLTRPDSAADRHDVT